MCIDTAQRAGFTLIELLVVITIIVTLLALLTPALDRAIYQAELTVCAAQQRSLGTAATQYAAANRRYYPDRSAPTGKSPYRVEMLTWPSVDYDMRRTMRGYADPQSQLDPLSHEVNFRDTPQDDNTIIYSSYNHWWGWQYKVSGRPTGGMAKIGNRWGSFWQDTKNEAPAAEPRTFRFDILIGDNSYWDTAVSAASHPDVGGGDVVMFEEYGQDVGPTFTWETRINGLPLVPGTFQGTLTRWVSHNGGARGDLDLSYTFADGSTQRYTGLSLYEYPKFIRVGHAETGLEEMQVPKRF